MIRNKKNEARSANKAANKARKEMEKDDKKRKRAVDKASKSAEKAIPISKERMIERNQQRYHCDYFLNHLILASLLLRK